MSYVARALELDEARGFMKAVVDADTGEILGAAVLGIEGGELMAIFEVAMLGKLPFTALRDAIFAHPTLAESLNNLFASLETPARAAVPVAGADGRAGGRGGRARELKAVRRREHIFGTIEPKRRVIRRRRRHPGWPRHRRGRAGAHGIRHSRCQGTSRAHRHGQCPRRRRAGILPRRSVRV
jgi:hypothetical protein